MRNWKTARGTGAAGYLLKDAEADEVAAAIRAAHRGEVHLGPALARQLTAALRAPSDSASQLIHAAAPNTVIQDAATVAEVIDQAARQSPDVVVCDLLLPRVEEGLQLVRRLAADDGVAVVAMSASYRLAQTRHRGGARAFIDKGGTPDAVVGALMAVTLPRVFRSWWRAAVKGAHPT